MWFPGRLPQTVLVAISFDLRRALRLGLCIANSFGQHLAKRALVFGGSRTPIAACHSGLSCSALGSLVM